MPRQYPSKMNSCLATDFGGALCSTSACGWRPSAMWLWRTTSRHTMVNHHPHPKPKPEKMATAAGQQ